MGDVRDNRAARTTMARRKGRWIEDEPSHYSQRGPRALPLWSKGGIVVGITLALLAAFVTRAWLQRGDWSESMLGVALAAGLLAGCTLLVGLARAVAGRRSLWTLLQTGLLIVSLLAVAAGSYFVAPSLHGVQAHNALRQGTWDEAITEFGLSGERAPNAPDIAGAYASWGEGLLASKQYAGAAEKLVSIVTTYAGSGQAVVTRARHDLYHTYNAWMRADAGHVRYGGTGGALAIFQAYQTDPACDASCHAELPTMLAQAHYEYGRQLVANHRYADAIPHFEVVTRLYASSAYATSAHAAAAQAYLARGKQQIAARACGGAVASYRAVVARYADTSEAAQASTALAAPQPVSGTFSGLPSNTKVTVALSSQVNTTGFIFSDDYTTAPNGATGAFGWPRVAQGDYNLSTKRDASGGASYTYYHDAKGNVYTVHVGPLCPVDLGAIAFTS